MCGRCETALSWRATCANPFKNHPCSSSPRLPTTLRSGDSPAGAVSRESATVKSRERRKGGGCTTVQNVRKRNFENLSERRSERGGAEDAERCKISATLPETGAATPPTRGHHEVHQSRTLPAILPRRVLARAVYLFGSSSGVRHQITSVGGNGNPPDSVRRSWGSNSAMRPSTNASQPFPP
jgi:hypothetical protein